MAVAPVSHRWVLVPFVVFVHAGLLVWLLWANKPTPVTPPTAVMDVVFITPPEDIPPPPKLPPEPPKEIPPPQPRIIPPKPAPEIPKPEVVVPQPEKAISPPPPPPPEPLPPPPAPVQVTPPLLNASNKGMKLEYPMVSKRLGEEGKGRVSLFVRADGTVGEVKIIKSTGFERLDRAAQKSMMTWKLKPAMRGNEAIAMWLEQPFEFNLKDAEI